MAFIDQAKFFVKAGDGGKGCVSFRREKFVPRGGPDGGDGGRGGSVIIESSNRIQSLIDFRFKSHFKAERGVHGKGKDMHGRKGKDCILTVPVGSIIKDSETGDVLADFNEDGERYVAAQGGKGGLGNPHFASGTNRTPRIATSGIEGEEQWLLIELKLIADIGLVGLPNAGKSTLLSRLSAANPKVAAYPFTTLEPQLGVLHLKYRESCIIADIPGLIEGAHEGVGLGFKFLRHIERTRILLHVLDASSEQVLEDFEVVANELAAYNDELANRTTLVILNKADIAGGEELDYLRQQLQKRKLDFLIVSGLTGEGIEALKERIEEMLDALNDSKEYAKCRQ
ncbi:MAG: GTPase ObgE [Desulfocapsa sp.]|nr:MAG: GTPase ObgE [Desulfocapsa sp.]